MVRHRHAGRCAGRPERARRPSRPVRPGAHTRPRRRPYRPAVRAGRSRQRLTARLPRDHVHRVRGRHHLLRPCRADARRATMPKMWTTLHGVKPTPPVRCAMARAGEVWRGASHFSSHRSASATTSSPSTSGRPHGHTRATPGQCTPATAGPCTRDAGPGGCAERRHDAHARSRVTTTHSHEKGTGVGEGSSPKGRRHGGVSRSHREHCLAHPL